MKKITALFLMFLYLIPAIGVTVSAHHCDGKITSVSLKFFDTHKCPCGDKAMKKDCCKDEAKTFKLSNEQQKAQTLSCNLKISGEFQYVALPVINLICRDNFFSTTDYTNSHPPDDLKHPLYIRHRIFRI